jgi:hypothetical protein
MSAKQPCRKCDKGNTCWGGIYLKRCWCKNKNGENTQSFVANQQGWAH